MQRVAYYKLQGIMDETTRCHGLVLRFLFVVINGIYLNFSIDSNRFEESIKCRRQYYATTAMMTTTMTMTTTHIHTISRKRATLYSTKNTVSTVNWARFSVYL